MSDWSGLYLDCKLLSESGFSFCITHDAYDPVKLRKLVEKYKASYAISERWTTEINIGENETPGPFVKSGFWGSHYKDSTLVGFRDKRVLMKFLLTNSNFYKVTCWPNRIRFIVRLDCETSSVEGIRK